MQVAATVVSVLAVIGGMVFYNAPQLEKIMNEVSVSDIAGFSSSSSAGDMMEGSEGVAEQGVAAEGRDESDKSGWRLILLT